MKREAKSLRIHASRFYRLPIYNSAGMTDAKIPDIQAGFEKAMSAVLAALAGSNFIHHAAGMLENMNTVAAEQFVIDNDILANHRPEPLNPAVESWIRERFGLLI